MTKLRSLGVAAVFLAGCAVGGGASTFVVPKASAQQAATLTRWEYHCPNGTEFNDWRTLATELGTNGWELVTWDYDQNGGRVRSCFKRAKM